MPNAAEKRQEIRKFLSNVLKRKHIKITPKLGYEPDVIRDDPEEKSKITITITNPLSDQARILADIFNLPIFDNDAKTIHVYSITEPKGDEDEEDGQQNIPGTDAPEVE